MKDNKQAKTYYSPALTNTTPSQEVDDKCVLKLKYVGGRYQVTSCLHVVGACYT